MTKRINENFEQAVHTIMAMSGRIVVIGMGKSGIIGQKITATLASTGTPAFFVHPGEAFHGDLGMIKPIDVALLISSSGETEEVIRILSFLKEQNNQIIAMTGNLSSTLAKHANIVLDISVSREACSNNLAPTSSTTCTLVLGDALAMVLQAERGFTPEDFARFHPGGNLGKKLLTKVSDVMKRDDLPICTPNSSFKEVVHSINKGCLGVTLVMLDDKLKGIITDGDIRRAFDKFENITKITAKDFMSTSPKTIDENAKFSEAEIYMKQQKINFLVVMRNSDVVGVLHLTNI
ncbi:KpsF/GutQ family sugar-phosphate isomerase [Avibacterium sp. 21-599]|nr:KpsF/GutQ family sugar-phosphate isomerase [Avibacterium sp. 21-599]MCW9717789.1 KpsF/GutQ family sugar-phosphate isomerase [Avibacterium sp. 21-599]